MSTIQMGMDTDKVERDFTKFYIDRLLGKIAELEANKVRAETLISELYEQVYDNLYLDKRVELYEALKETK